MGKLVDYSPWGCKESDITEHTHTHTHARMRAYGSLMETQKAIKKWKLIYHPKLRKGVGIWGCKWEEDHSQESERRWLENKGWPVMQISYLGKMYLW